MPATATALHASLPDLTRRRWPGAVGLVMWNMRKIHFSHCCKTAAARMAVKGAPLSSAFIGAKRRPLTATAAEATARERAGMPVPPPIFSFQHVDAAATSGYRAVTAYTPFFF